ncbi:hypothetical protein BRADI_4g20020v3 [Brachypodium distachyon]|uniref:O-methyltransferase domain-containing protein n=2 Tax=Brachypodium distachyon TaxID=15368 RepID=I1ILX9_BRADI|nr:hypothetical protein BRADI_4g20020v3 [Brachypodium distachyon]
MAQTTQTTKELESGAELLQAQADLWRHSLGFYTSMALQCAVKLGVPSAIRRSHGATASLPDILDDLSVPPSKLPFLRRVMRLLVTSGVFTSHADETDPSVVYYGLTPVSRLLVDGTVPGSEAVGGRTSQASFVLACTARLNIDAAQGLVGWLQQKPEEEETKPLFSPFAWAHDGASLFERGRVDPEFNGVLNEGMAANSRLGILTVLRECRPLFENLQSLTDCGGGDGATARAITRTFPHVKCTVLDLPHVIAAATVPSDDGIQYVAGDMFESIPPSQAILVKYVLHDWSDEQCVKVLARCREAIPCREAGGKVIVVEVVLGASSPCCAGPMHEAELLMDMAMMCMTTGHEREEHEWRSIFVAAGFSDYKINKALGVQCVIEVYP